VNAHILHFHWDADCLVFCFVKSKGDQTGKNRHQEWSSVCPVLALGCYIFANPGVFLMSTAEVDAMNGADVDSMNDGGVVEGTVDGVVEGTVDGPRAGRHPSQKGHLFPGDCQYNRFMGCLHRITDKYLDNFFVLGISPGNLGLHSARKGVSSHASSSTTVSPPMVSILPLRDVGHGAREGLLPSV
jgi:hypothetical protein